MTLHELLDRFENASVGTFLGELALAGSLVPCDQKDGVRLVSDSTVRLFTTRAAGWRALGWETCYGGGSCGHYLSERAYGHTGYAGTSIWIDPQRDLRSPVQAIARLAAGDRVGRAVDEGTERRGRAHEEIRDPFGVGQRPIEPGVR